MSLICTSKNGTSVIEYLYVTDVLFLVSDICCYNRHNKKTKYLICDLL